MSLEMLFRYDDTVCWSVVCSLSMKNCMFAEYFVPCFWGDKSTVLWWRLFSMLFKRMKMLMTKCHLFIALHSWPFVSSSLTCVLSSLFFWNRCRLIDHGIPGTVNGIMVWIGIRCQGMVGWMSISVSGMDRKVSIPEKPFLYNRLVIRTIVNDAHPFAILSWVRWSATYF